MRFFILGGLFLANVFVWAVPVPHGLAVSFLDVGQGRAVLIEGPKGARVLVDGGPDSSVVRSLGSRLPFFARSLDAVIETDPDAPNIGGLPGVFERYRVGTFVEPGIASDTKAATALQGVVAASGAERRIARRGMRILLGGGAYIGILYPDRDVSDAASHDASVVLRVVYGGTSVLLSGDAPLKTQKQLLAVEAGALRSDAVLAPHYGSKDSVLGAFADAIAPRIAVFSASCDNRWGYPVLGTVQIFEAAGARVFRTCEDGTVSLVSDGHALRISEAR